ncbi:SRPBCC family protein [Candidatus Bathyarchaeota archaeon]|nr:SRPBCC family protein [Candidatus Bathyarchaeota archaeon]
MEKTVKINAPIEKVWDLISNVERIPEWAKGYTEKMTITSKQRRGKGVTTHEVGVAFGNPYEKDFIITEWIEKRKIVFESTSGWSWKGVWLMKDAEGAVLFTYSVDFEPPFPITRLKDVFRKKYEKLLEEWVQNIKNILEKADKPQDRRMSEAAKTLQ